MLPHDKQESHPAAPSLYHHFQTGEECLVSRWIFKGQGNVQLIAIQHNTQFSMRLRKKRPRYSKIPSGQAHRSPGGIKCMLMDNSLLLYTLPCPKDTVIHLAKIKTMHEKKSFAVVGDNLESPKVKGCLSITCPPPDQPC